MLYHICGVVQNAGLEFQPPTKDVPWKDTCVVKSDEDGSAFHNVMQGMMHLIKYTSTASAEEREVIKSDMKVPHSPGRQYGYDTVTFWRNPFPTVPIELE